MVTDEKLFGCPYCGFRINPDELQCPRCGNKFETGTKFECPFCGDLVGPGMEACPSCHINFDEFKSRVKKTAKTDSIDSLLMDIIMLEATEVKSEAKKFSCPNCDLLLDGSEDKCPRCHTDLSESSAFQCPVCGEFVDAEASRCSECGSSFEGEDHEAADHEAVSTALDDILDSAGLPGPLPEVEQKPLIEEEPPAPPEPEVEVAPPPEPEPIPEPVPEPVHEPVPEPEPIHETAPTPTPPKKPRQRKLKAKPSGTTAQERK